MSVKAFLPPAAFIALVALGCGDGPSGPSPDPGLHGWVVGNNDGGSANYPSHHRRAGMGGPGNGSGDTRSGALIGFSG